MLGRVVKQARFIDHVREMTGMAGRKTVMASRLDVQQFVEWIPVRQPRRAFLIGDEQVADPVERHPNGEADAGADRLAFCEIGADTLNGAALGRRAVASLAGRLIHPIRLGETGGAEAEIDAAIRRNGNSQCVHALLFTALGPGGHRDLLVGPVIAVFVHNERHLLLRRHENTLAPRVAGRRERRADRRAKRLLVPERLDLVLDPVAIAVAQQPDATVVTDRDQLAVGAIADIVDVIDVHRQCPRLKTGEEDLDRRWVGNGHQRHGPFACGRTADAVKQRAVFGVEITLD